LNEKLDQGDKRKCRNLPTSATHEKALWNQIGKRLQTKRLQAKPKKRQNMCCKAPDKLNAVCLLMGTNKTEFSTKANGWAEARRKARSAFRSRAQVNCYEFSFECSLLSYIE